VHTGNKEGGNYIKQNLAQREGAKVLKKDRIYCLGSEGATL
jgi:hypothetical protein